MSHKHPSAVRKEGVCEWQKRPQPFRARMCEHMVNGKCQRPGGNCYYAHTEPELIKWKALFAPTKQCRCVPMSVRFLRVCEPVAVVCRVAKPCGMRSCVYVSGA